MGVLILTHRTPVETNISLNASLAGFARCVSWKSITLTALLRKLKLELIPITERSVHRDKPAASFKC